VTFCQVPSKKFCITISFDVAGAIVNGAVRFVITPAPIERAPAAVLVSVRCRGASHSQIRREQKKVVVAIDHLVADDTGIFIYQIGFCVQQAAPPIKLALSADSIERDAFHSISAAYRRRGAKQLWWLVGLSLKTSF